MGQHTCSLEPYGDDWHLDRVITGAGVAIPLRATARRPSWDDLPAGLQRRVHDLAGAHVVEAVSAGSGFTPGFASRLRLADGRRVFVKAASSGYDAEHGWPLSNAYREEVRKLSRLPPGIPAPTLQWSLDESVDGETWVLLGLEDVDGRPPRRPWRPTELALVTDTLARIAPALAAVPAGLELATFAEDFGNWPQWLAHVRDRDGDSARLQAVADLAAEALERCSGPALAHLDLRDDNILVDRRGHVWICDWNWPLRGACWLDLVSLLISAYGDGLDVEATLRSHVLTRDVDPRSVDAFLSCLWLYFSSAKDTPVPASSPYIRIHQTWYADVVSAWLRDRLSL